MLRAISVMLIAGCGSDRDLADPTAVRHDTAARELSALLSPEILGPVALVPPMAGQYAMRLELSYEAHPTSDLYVMERRDGAWNMKLAEDGTVHSCLGSRRSRGTVGQYSYEPDPAKLGRTRNEERNLVAFGGTWSVTDGVASIVVDRIQANDCNLAHAVRVNPRTALRCISIEHSHQQGARLACDMAEGFDAFGLGLPLTVAAHVPTYVQTRTAPDGKQVVFGVPGLLVEVQQLAGDARPNYRYEPKAGTLIESDFRPTAERVRGPR